MACHYAWKTSAYYYNSYSRPTSSRFLILILAQHIQESEHTTRLQTIRLAVSRFLTTLASFIICPSEIL